MSNKTSSDWITKIILGLGIVAVVFLSTVLIPVSNFTQVSTYSGVLERMDYRQNGFGHVFDSNLTFTDGTVFTVEGYQTFAIGQRYQVIYNTTQSFNVYGSNAFGDESPKVVNVTLAMGESSP